MPSDLDVHGTSVIVDVCEDDNATNVSEDVAATVFLKLMFAKQLMFV